MKATMNLNDIWPCSVSRLTRATIRSLSEEDFHELCRRIYRRARKHSANDRHPDELV